MQHTITISIAGEGIPVDKMSDDGDGPTCPIATQDMEANEQAMQNAVVEANYRDPAEDGGFKLTEVCGNCGAYNQTQDMLDCIGDDSGELGYCQLYKFLCSSDRICNDWIKGGPIKAMAEGSERDIL